MVDWAKLVGEGGSADAEAGGEGDPSRSGPAASSAHLPRAASGDEAAAERDQPPASAERSPPAEEAPIGDPEAFLAGPLEVTDPDRPALKPERGPHATDPASVPSSPPQLAGFASGEGADEETKTSPFSGQSAGPWEVPSTPPPTDPDDSIISEITDPGRRAAAALKPSPLVSAEGAAATVDEGQPPSGEGQAPPDEGQASPDEGPAAARSGAEPDWESPGEIRPALPPKGSAPRNETAFGNARGPSPFDTDPGADAAAFADAAEAAYRRLTRPLAPTEPTEPMAEAPVVPEPAPPGQGSDELFFTAVEKEPTRLAAEVAPPGWFDEDAPGPAPAEGDDAPVVPPDPDARSHYARPELDPLSDDDEDPALAFARAQRRTRVMVAGALLLFGGGAVVALVASGALDPAPAAELARAEPAPLPDEERAAPGGEEVAEPAATEPAEAPPEKAAPSPEEAKPLPEEAEPPPEEDEPAATAEGRPIEAAPEPERRRAAVRPRVAAERAPEEPSEPRSRAASERDDRPRVSARAAPNDDEADRRRTRRARARKPSRRDTPSRRVAGATPRRISVVAPARIRWLSPTGQKLGGGSGFLTVPPGVSTVLAIDPISDVRTFLKVSDGEQLDYGALKKGTLDIRVFPYAEVWAGKKKLGDAPFAPLEVIEGQYRLKLVHEGRVERRTVKVKAGRTTRVKVSFAVR